MLIRIGYDLRFWFPADTPVVALLKVHPSRTANLREPDVIHFGPALPANDYTDGFGNLCTRFLAPAGELHLSGRSLFEDTSGLDATGWGAPQVPIHALPPETLQFLIASRYCEVDLLSGTALDLFGAVNPGWDRVQAVCNWVHGKVTFGYGFARPTKTAFDVFAERKGVCRDFQHLAITFCRSLGIPARYATGYLGDIRVPPSSAPMDFSAWFEVFLGDRWWTVDARHNEPRAGRVLMAVGRDAADVALTTAFGQADLRGFSVVSDEVR